MNKSNCSAQCHPPWPSGLCGLRGPLVQSRAHFLNRFTQLSDYKCKLRSKEGPGMLHKPKALGAHAGQGFQRHHVLKPVFQRPSSMRMASATQAPQRTKLPSGLLVRQLDWQPDISSSEEQRRPYFLVLPDIDGASAPSTGASKQLHELSAAGVAVSTLDWEPSCSLTSFADVLAALKVRGPMFVCSFAVVGCGISSFGRAMNPV